MKSLNFAKSNFLLTARLKTEKFIKEQLWQLLLVVAFVVLCAIIFEKPIEAFCFCVAHIVIRAKFDKQYHSSLTRVCLFITSCVVFFGIMLCMPIKQSLLSTIPIAFLVAAGGYLVAYKIESDTPKPFNTDTCTESELIERCRELHLSAENTELAVEFFIRKTKQSVIAERLCIDEKSVTTRKKRLKLKLNT